MTVLLVNENQWLVLFLGFSNSAAYHCMGFREIYPKWKIEECFFYFFVVTTVFFFTVVIVYVRNTCNNWCELQINTMKVYLRRYERKYTVETLVNLSRITTRKISITFTLALLFWLMNCFLTTRRTSQRNYWRKRTKYPSWKDHFARKLWYSKSAKRHRPDETQTTDTLWCACLTNLPSRLRFCCWYHLLRHRMGTVWSFEFFIRHTPGDYSSFNEPHSLQKSLHRHKPRDVTNALCGDLGSESRYM